MASEHEDHFLDVGVPDISFVLKSSTDEELVLRGPIQAEDAFFMAVKYLLRCQRR